MGPADLADTLNGLKLFRPDQLLVGFETGDDAGVFDMGNGLYLVQTVDFITPVVDDAYDFGRISALNSMSDVYAMGGTPVTALSVLLYNCSIGGEIIKTMLQGAADEFAKAGCALAGGHTVYDPEIKLGFSITGKITNGKIYKNVGLREGDILIYTKPLGIGLISTALKAQMASPEDIKAVTDTMLMSNAAASEIMKKYDVSACTDVTGFSLAGHSYEMASGSGVTIEIDSRATYTIEGAFRYAKDFIIPAGAYSNMEFLKGRCEFETKPDNAHMVFFDPQTSGGLLIGVSETDSNKLLGELLENGIPAQQIAYATAKKENSVIIR
ncbi:selenide, water dikinase [Denitrovibrio acetiphilus DSM 12809]|uniref:Selenide, water dikinase n=2 Tax=Denitrovibrio TaxID=117999 RepID=D4H4Z3_DENA2|nr:selenide, water dikinase SelD [Denitrovibrio acetiphilus]ADD69349.1 selenide, water dikinase [Denitrovibrio acetiphilus DSM 12809]